MNLTKHQALRLWIYQHCFSLSKTDRCFQAIKDLPDNKIEIFKTIFHSGARLEDTLDVIDYVLKGKL